MRILLVHTYYPEYLADLYASDPGLGHLDFNQQQQRILDTGFCLADAYSNALRGLGCAARDVIVNADPAQARWATEHGLTPSGNIHDRRREIVHAQVNHYRPDVLYVFEWCPLGDAFLADIKPNVGLLVGQIASPLRENRTYGAYDLMISSWPPLVSHFRSEGIHAEPLRLAFDARVLDRLSGAQVGADSLRPQYDVTFVGGFALSHTDRIAWLEDLLSEIDIDVFGYGVETTPQSSAIRTHHRGHAWGWRMYEVLRRSRVTLNRHAHIDIRGTINTNLANNMRLYEATGAGTCLVTEHRDNLEELFHPGGEVVAYEDGRDCVQKVRHYLEHEDERVAIAKAGQRRTLRDHTYTARMAELLEILRRHL